MKVFGDAPLTTGIISAVLTLLILILSEIIPKTLGGVFPGEKSGQITLREANGKSRKIKSSDIKNRRDIISTTPPMGQILTKREIRDLVEYLSSLKTKK